MPRVVQLNDEGMLIRIHRGAKEIGGNCVELRAGGKSLLLDLGMPLGDPDMVVPTSLSSLAAEENILGIVVSHLHMDHYGLINQVFPGAHIYMGEEAHKILRASLPFVSDGDAFENVSHYEHQQPFNVGPFRITPYLVDHSAFDAYALLVEAGGRSLFYTGDFRAHGRKTSLFQQLLDDGPGGIDTMLIEGTALGREGSDNPYLTEQGLEEEIVKEIKNTSGIVLACFAAQNIDRFVTFFKASKRSGRTFVVDAYLACILDAIGRPTLPSPHGRDLAVFLPIKMKSRLLRDRNPHVVNPYKDRRIYPDKLAERAGQLVMLFRPSMTDDLEKANCLEGANLIYSLWPGYLNRSYPHLQEWCSSHGIGFKILHTSGHADIATLQRLVNALHPKRIVPIHTSEPQQLSALFPNAQPVEDGQWWAV